MLTKDDFKSNQRVKWCPGCGDYAILAAIQTTMAKAGIPREKFVVVSGIGCSGRFPYYMNTYGFHSVHGRAPAVATGIKLANPDLHVWVTTGDGDAFAIGGNHVMHAMRRNADIKIVLFNNGIYGLTKGQCSPLSRKGKTTKSTPYGSSDEPINPIAVTLAAGATFVARTIDSDPKHMKDVFEAAQEHQGVAFVEVLQNCVIFNHGSHTNVTGRSVRQEKTVDVRDEFPMTFGAKHDKGLRLEGFSLTTVMADEDRSNVIAHDESDAGLAFLLSQLRDPVPIGVFRRVAKPTLGCTSPQEAAPRSIDDILRGDKSWKIQ